MRDGELSNDEGEREQERYEGQHQDRRPVAPPKGHEGEDASRHRGYASCEHSRHHRHL